MQEKITTILATQFEEDVFKGLTDFPKHLSSKYFYDENGDRLFQDIMNMPEYYLTDCEFDILETHKDEITALFSEGVQEFNLIELGAGDGKKTKVLLKHLSEKNIAFKYMPIDISQNALDQLAASLNTAFPKLAIETLQGTYFETLEHISTIQHSRKVILFLGSNIGNLLHPQAVEFLRSIQQLMEEDDLLFIGFDQKKNPQTVLEAYNDKTGITEAFNKNVLSRINREFDANFNLDQFIHWEVYDPETGTAKSYLVSKIKQTVLIKTLGLEVNFKPWETIHTEISQKYDDEIVSWLAEKAGLYIETEFADKGDQYKNYVLRKKE